MNSTEVTRTLRLRLKDKHSAFLREQAREVNFVWNYCNELSYTILQREGRFCSNVDLDKLTAGATKVGLSLHSQTVQAISKELVTRRKQFKKAKLRWRVSGGSRRSLGWIPLKASAIRYKGGQVWYAGRPLSLWDSYGLADYELGPGSFSEDSRGRWYLNVVVKVMCRPSAGTAAVGIDLGLKTAATASTGQKADGGFYRTLEEKLRIAQRAHKKQRVKAIHAKVANQRKDLLHKFSSTLVAENAAIFVGDVASTALVKTKMAKSTLDAGWSLLKTMLEYKCQQAGVIFMEVNEAYTTQACSCCGAISASSPKGRPGLRIREWTCCDCGAVHDRDINAAKNILARGLARLAAAQTGSAQHLAAVAKRRAETSGLQLSGPRASDCDVWSCKH